MTAAGSRDLHGRAERLATAVRRLFPPSCAVAAEPFNADLSLLTPTEAAAVSQAVPKRQGEFVAGRVAARRALANLGLVRAEIAALPNRAPRWPDGTVGSISHAGDLAIAAVARTAEVTALGLDLEVTGAVAAELIPLLLIEDEQQWVSAQPAAEQPRWTTALFSAKETFYKYQHPLTGQWLDFRQVGVQITPPNAFSIRVLQPDHPVLVGDFLGRLLEFEGMTVTAMHASVA